jgi:hypothetical protein
MSVHKHVNRDKFCASLLTKLLANRRLGVRTRTVRTHETRAWASFATVVGMTLLSPALISSDVRAAERPPVMGPTAAVSAGDPLVTAAAFETLLAGGNAFDAGVTSLLVGGIIEQDLFSLGGGRLWCSSTREQKTR